MLLPTPNRLTTAHLKGDLAGGLIAAIVALPLALAFGVASGAGAIAGMYSAICIGLMAALFGGTATQISGPTGPMTIVAAALFTQFGNEPAVAFTVVMMTGAFQILFGYLKIGRYINLMPYPVISGFISGIGVILIFMQLDPLLGYPSPGTVNNAITVLPEYLKNPNLAALAVGLLSTFICFATPARIRQRVPPPLIALVLGTLAAMALPNVPVLGAIPTGLPTLIVPQFDVPLLSNMINTALILAALGSIDSLLTSLVADNATGTFHDSNKELIGQGLGNLVAGIFGGIAGAGATVRTLSNIQAGGRTPLSGVIHALVLIVILLGLSPLVALIPHAVLSGILLKVGIDVIDWRSIRRARRLPRTDQVLMVVCLLLTVFVDVVTAAGIGIILASLLFVKQAADIQIESIRTLDGTDADTGKALNPEGIEATMLSDNELALLREARGAIRLIHFSGLMSFGAANEMARRFARLGNYDVLLLDLVDVQQIDGSAGLQLEAAIQRALMANREVVIVGLSYRVARVLNKLGCLELVKETHRFSERLTALEAALAFVKARAKASTDPAADNLP